MEPQIVFPDLAGRHNAQATRTLARLARGKGYRDLSTVCVVPTRGMIPAKVVQSWMGLLTPMNQKFCRLFVIGMEVGEAYSHAVEQILAHPELSTWKYLLTLEEDNLPPPDGLLKLYESMDDYDVVGGLYWTKGEGGQPMIYGDPQEIPASFRPQLPQPETVQPARGLGMGFTLFKLALFKDPRWANEKPYFKTLQQYLPGQGVQAYTQDLFFFEKAARLGFKCASDNRVKVGHLDVAADLIW